MKISLKNGLYLLSFSILVSLMASCLGGNYNEDDYDYTDAEILSFSLYHSDSLPDLEYVIFTIDQRNNLIYNYDSMTYLTTLPEKVFISYTTFLSGSAANVLDITDGDSIWISPGDSIDFSKPKTLKVFALDEKTTKIYTAQLNIHQVDPDSLQYHQLTSELPFLQTNDAKTIMFNGHFLTYSRIGNQIQLLSSPDAVEWTQETVLGLPANAVIGGIQGNENCLFAYTEDGELYVRDDPTVDQWILVNKPASIKIKSILGYLPAGPKQPKGLCLIVENDGIYNFAFTENFSQWEYGTVPVPDDFPLYSFSNHSYQVMLTGRISIFGGISLNGIVRNAAWSTENGRYWAKLSSDRNVFPQLEGANVFYYNDEFWLINGKSGDNYNREVYYSIDRGVTWLKKSVYVCTLCRNNSSAQHSKCPYCGEIDGYFEEAYQLPNEYPGRYNAGLVTDMDNKHFYIIGGKQTTVLPNIWKGFLNKMEFEH